MMTPKGPPFRNRVSTNGNQAHSVKVVSKGGPLAMHRIFAGSPRHGVKRAKEHDDGGA